MQSQLLCIKSCLMCRLLQQCLRSHLLVDLHPAQQLALDSVISVIGVCDSVTSAAGVYERCLLCCLLQQRLRSHLLVDPNTPVGTRHCNTSYWCVWKAVSSAACCTSSSTASCLLITIFVCFPECRASHSSEVLPSSHNFAICSIAHQSHSKMNTMPGVCIILYIHGLCTPNVVYTKGLVH